MPSEAHEENELLLIFSLQVNALYLHMWEGYLFSIYLAWKPRCQAQAEGLHVTIHNTVHQSSQLVAT